MTNRNDRKMWWCSFSIHPNSMDMKISRSSRASCSVRLRASNAANSLHSQSHALAQCQCNKWRCACALDYPPQFLGRLLGLSQCTAYIYSRWDAVHRHSYTNHVQQLNAVLDICVCLCQDRCASPVRMVFMTTRAPRMKTKSSRPNTQHTTSNAQHTFE